MSPAQIKSSKTPSKPHAKKTAAKVAPVENKEKKHLLKEDVKGKSKAKDERRVKEDEKPRGSKKEAKAQKKGKTGKVSIPEPEVDKDESGIEVLDAEVGSEEENVDEEGDEANLGGEGSGEEEEDSKEEDDDEENDGVTEEGIARLMKALGNDGLDDFGRAQLNALEDDGEGDEEDEESVGSNEEDENEDVEMEAEENPKSKPEQVTQPTDGGESEDDDDDGDVIALDEAEDIELDEDAVPRRKLVINNKIALDRIRETIQLDPSFPWTETLVVTYPQKIEVEVDDDLNRELAFYKQALHGAGLAKTLAAKHKLPFTRPADYFAEMVKSDAHMERIRQRLLDETANIKKSEEKRREREGKKFGKQVQVEKLKERERNKKEMEDRLQSLKRKRKDVLDAGANRSTDNDGFDIAVEDAISDRPSKRSKGPDGKPKISRKGRDQKFGFGGAGRRAKQNTKESTDTFADSGRKKFGGKPGKGGKRHSTKRLGKSRRVSGKSK